MTYFPNSRLHRTTPLRRSRRERAGTALERSRKRIRAAGKKGRAWAKARRELKVEFERVYGITACEERGPGCMVDDGLGFAHRLKRRFIQTKDELMHVALLCNACHDRWETAGHERMREAIDRIIAGRDERRLEAA